MKFLCTMTLRPIISRKIKVLVVDDSKLITDRLQGMLSGLDYVNNVWHVENYDDALHFLEAQKPDVILLDIQLKGKGGIDILTYIKQHSIPGTVIMFTNNTDEYYQTLCRNIGAEYYLDKSNDFEKIPELLETIYEKNKK
ncbi:MAG: response regulator [Bacteroidia bacterium]|nr:response regulator [Bacteroidia bacterium]